MLLKFVYSNQGADAQTAAYQNAMLSQAGSIRKAHDIPTWLAKIQTMCQSGMSADAIIRTRNSRSSKEGQLQGGKRTCLLNLLQCPQAGLEVLQTHASVFGSQTAFSEECFSQKSILPGHVPRLPSKQWSARLTVSNESFILMMKTVDAAHHERLPALRTKLPKDAMLDAAQLAYLALAVTEQLKEKHGVSSDKIVQAHINGDVHLSGELHLALHEKSSAWEIRSLSIVKEILREHNMSIEKLHPQSQRTVKAAELEKEEFDVLLATWEFLAFLKV